MKVPPHRFRMAAVRLAAMVALALGTSHAALPDGYSIPDDTRSPDGQFGVLVPERRILDQLNTATARNRIVEIKTGRSLGEIQGRIGFEANHISYSAQWSPDSKRLLWTVDGKWGQLAIVVVKLGPGQIEKQDDLLAPIHKSILERTKAAQPKAYAAVSKRGGVMQNSTLPPGFAVSVKWDPADEIWPIDIEASFTTDVKSGYPDEPLITADLVGRFDGDATLRFADFRAYVPSKGPAESCDALVKEYLELAKRLDLKEPAPDYATFGVDWRQAWKGNFLRRDISELKLRLAAKEAETVEYAGPADAALTLSFTGMREGEVGFNLMRIGESRLDRAAGQLRAGLGGDLIDADGRLRCTGIPNDARLTITGGGELGGDYQRIGTADAVDLQKQRIAAADRLLNRTYQKTLKTLTRTRGDELRAKQRDWINKRDAELKALALFVTKGDEQAQPSEVPDCREYLLNLLVDRVEFFAAFEGSTVSPGIAGVYVDSFGGSLELHEAPGGVAFDIAVVRGRMAGRLGFADGVARWIGTSRSHARWTDPDNAECRIDFAFHDHHKVTVTGENTREHHGHRASFDGEYYKAPKVKP